MYKAEVDIQNQTLSVLKDDSLVRQYFVSTASNGSGQLYGSECTPLGRHIIRAKIGAGMPVNTVFVARRPTGEYYDADLAQQNPQRDWILTRILWLSGCERGLNRLGDVDTMRRYIYIHGCPDTDVMGVPGSHGCIKMHNADVIELFDLLPVYTEVTIT